MARITVPEGYQNASILIVEQHAPEQARIASAFGRVIYENTKLPFRIVEAARMRTAQINGCAACQTFRAARDLRANLERKGGSAKGTFVARGDPEPDEAFYEAIATWRDATIFSERERLAIEFAERMGLEPRGFEGDEPFWQRMHAAFSEAEIVDLTLSVASWIATGRALHILEIDPKTCPIDTEATTA